MRAKSTGLVSQVTGLNAQSSRALLMSKCGDREHKPSNFLAGRSRRGAGRRGYFADLNPILGMLEGLYRFHSINTHSYYGGGHVTHILGMSPEVVPGVSEPINPSPTDPCHPPKSSPNRVLQFQDACQLQLDQHHNSKHIPTSHTGNITMASHRSRQQSPRCSFVRRRETVG